MTELAASGIYHKSQGSGGPIVVIHGLFGSLENLGVIARSLAKHYCVYSIDLPNHGRSAHTDDMSLEAMAVSVERWMGEQGIEQATLLGHSLGGKVAMELALMYPQRVDSLVVADIAPVKYQPRHDNVFAGFASVDTTTISGRAEADQSMATFVTELGVRSFLLKNLVKQNDQWQWRMNLESITRNYLRLIGGNSDSLPTFNKPVLFIKGELSSYITAGHWPEVTKRFPSAKVKMITGTEHWLHAEKPAVFTGIVERFLLSVKAIGS